MQQRPPDKQPMERTYAEKCALQGIEMALDGDEFFVFYLIKTIQHAEQGILKLHAQQKLSQIGIPTPFEKMQVKDIVTLLAMATFTLMVGPQKSYWIAADELLDLSYFIAERFEPSHLFPFTREQIMDAYRR